jgi:histidine kinase
LIKDDGYFIEAEGEVDKDTYNIMNSIPLDKSENLSRSIVRYVIKTQENIILDDAEKEGKFSNDDYIIKNKSKSILSIPVINQGKVIGAVYLENNIISGAFTTGRIELVKIISSQAAVSIENSRLIIEIKDKERLKSEMEIAERIQTALIPVTPENEEIDIVSFIKPAEEVGGDYYDILYDGKKKLWFAIGDVSGHGVTPGLIMMMAQTAFNNLIGDRTDLLPKDVLVSVNRILCKNVRFKLKENHFMTMTILKYDGNGKFIFSGAHLDIIIYRKKIKKIERIKTEGVFLAVLPDITDKLKNQEFILDKDDIMILYTDGLIEAKNINDRNKLWGIDNLCMIIENNSEKNISEIKDMIIKNVFDWCGNKLDDDITLMVIKRKI